MIVDKPSRILSPVLKRRPFAGRSETVVVSLVEAEQEYDRVSLDLARDFKLVDPSGYAPRSEIVLHGPPGAR
jgi:hypothetical protein